MPSWKEVLEENVATGSPFDVTRKKYLSKLHEKTGRNVIVYYSGWLQRAITPELANFVSLNDSDIHGFMATIKGLDRSKGLDLILHTPGGDIGATESLVNYLRSMFDNDIRAIIPQIAMSAGTMVALSCKEIWMGKHSSMGPIDPQLGGMAAHGIIEEFTRMSNDAQTKPYMVPLWQVVLNKYNPTLIGESQKAMDLTRQVVKDWLCTGMFTGDPDAVVKADKIIIELADHALTKSHSRHLSFQYFKDNIPELKIRLIEDDDELQDCVLSVHHACIQTLSQTPAIKIIQNHEGIAFIQHVQNVAMSRSHQ
jgi:ATP-dependent protease ClpP protease subunit